MPHDNPLGLDGFEFVEFTSPDPEALGGTDDIVDDACAFVFAAQIGLDHLRPAAMAPHHGGGLHGAGWRGAVCR